MVVFDRDALWEQGEDEAVQVNQRALIDKVLARYSGEFTVFRELLQNSDDALSKAVEIHFFTDDFEAARDTQSAGSNAVGTGDVPDLNTALIARWIFKNDGMLFREEDWNRLKKIAEGNPDEDKIGAFGVGFYSLFSVTEEPFVTSGENWMGFYWKGDQLVARKGLLERDDAEPLSPWTSFNLPLREPAPMPKSLDFIQFLCSSLTFMNTLRSVSVYLNDTRLAHITKNSASPRKHDLPRNLRVQSDGDIMRIVGIQSTSVDIIAEVIGAVYRGGSAKPPKALPAPTATSEGRQTQRAFFSSLISSLLAPSTSAAAAAASQAQQAASASTAALNELPEEKPLDPREVVTSTIRLTVFTATANVSMDKKLAEELHRSTKKNPPKSVKYSLIYTGSDAYEASIEEDRKLALKGGSVFQGLRADLDGGGNAKVFIGHATGQTTGLGGHMAARFIPTVERESIDLVDTNVAIWNRELLYIGGYLSRAAYEFEMDDIRRLWLGAAQQGNIDDELREWLYKRCLHCMKFFSFHASTPSPVVAHLLEAAFYDSSLNSALFPLISSHGVSPVKNVRTHDATFAKFIKNLAIVPPEIQSISEPPRMLEALKRRLLLKSIVLTDVLDELRSRPLTETEMIDCLNWLFSVDTSGIKELSGELRRQFLHSAVLSVKGQKEGQYRIIALSSIQTYVSQQQAGSVIPLDEDLPLPPHTFPYSLSRVLPGNSLETFFGWKPLQLTAWLQHFLSLQKGQPFTPELATRVVLIIARSWGSLDNNTRNIVKGILVNLEIIPTRDGLKKPADAYFPKVDVFPDLPVIQFPRATNKSLDQMLEALGVRNHVDLQIVFNRMYRTGSWKIPDLVKYLTSIQKDLTEDEVRKLRQTEVFTEEQQQPQNTSGLNSDGTINKSLPPVPSGSMKRYNAGQLYEPTDSNRTLGLPILNWGDSPRWRTNSAEALFMYHLGLKKTPSLATILELAARLDLTQRTAALNYFLEHFEDLYKDDYKPGDFEHIRFVPAIEAGGAFFLGKPSEVFVDPEAAIFGFSVIQPHLRPHALLKLKLSEKPPTALIVKLLQRMPPQDVVQANRWFEALSNRIGDFDEHQKTVLSKTAFIPKKVVDAKGARIILYKPTECYLSHEEAAKFHSQLFVFVDFSSKASHFLHMCGIKDAPTAIEIAQILVDDPKSFLLKSGDREIFLSELRNIAVNMHRMPASVLNKISKNPCLLGLRRQTSATYGKSPARDDEDEDEWQYTHELALPKHIAIVDDTATYALFADLILAAPQEDILENFYAARGSPRLSTLIKQDYRPIGVAKDSSYAAELKTLVLSRLSLFLYEHGNTRTKVDFDWLSKEGNFNVEGAQKIQLTKHISWHGINASRSIDASAAAIRGPRNGPVTLWIAGDVDMYEVANSLLSIILKAHKVNDALLLSTILSTDLKSLRRRGYNVDRVLKHMKAQRAAQEAEERRQAEIAQEKMALSEKPQEKVPGAYQDPPLAAFSPAAGPISPPPSYQQQEPSQDSGLFGRLRRLTNRASKHDLSASAATSRHTPMASISESGSNTLIPRPANQFSPILSGQPSPSAVETTAPPPHAPGTINHHDIQSNVKQAIMACRPTNFNLLQNRSQMNTVKEAMEDGYCDVTGMNKDIRKAGDCSGFVIYLTSDVPDPVNFLNTNRAIFDRFAQTVDPLATIYDIPRKAIHIFSDMEGGLIAFNRNGSIFLNFRYFRAWHDEEVLAGRKADAYISWFFTLAHEIAHNLVGPHNSEHEFYFSSIAEAHMQKLCELLNAK